MAEARERVLRVHHGTARTHGEEIADRRRQRIFIGYVVHADDERRAGPHERVDPGDGRVENGLGDEAIAPVKKAASATRSLVAFMKRSLSPTARAEAEGVGLP